jgi:hypothetical protein
MKNNGGILVKRLPYWIVFLLFLLACAPYSWLTPSPRPTLTPSSPSRILGKTDNFPWRERWRIRMYLGGYYQNVRTLVPVEKGVISIHNPTGQLPQLEFVKSSDGGVQWIVELKGWIDSIAVDENQVYVAGQIGPFVEAYNLQTGKFVWQSNVLPGHALYYLRSQEKGHGSFCPGGNFTISQLLPAPKMRSDE